MPKKNENNPDSIFPLLRIPALCKHAQMWAAQYDFVKTITLYEAPNHLLKTLAAVKYVVVFDLPGTGAKQAIQKGDADFELKMRIQTFKEMFAIFTGPPGIDDNFYKEIYKEQFTPSLREEWLFSTETPEGVIAECSLVLYENRNQQFSIKDITICYKNNAEVKVGISGNRMKSYDKKQMGFIKDNKNTEWRTFLDIIKNPPFHFYAGKKSAEPHFYDTNRQLLYNINKKLLRFFKDFLNIKLPEKYKLFELCSGEKPGSYCFKFKIVIEKERGYIRRKLEALPKDTLIKKFSEFCEENRVEQTDKHLEKIDTAAIILLEKQWLSKEEILSYTENSNHSFYST